MKHRPTNEINGDFLIQCCTNIGEEMKYLLAEISYHNAYFPKNKISIEYFDDEKKVVVNDINNGEFTFSMVLYPGEDLRRTLGIVHGYTCGLKAAGVKSETPKEL